MGNNILEEATDVTFLILAQLIKLSMKLYKCNSSQLAHERL